MDAQASADQAAESARQARAAEAQAHQSAREASNSAAQAERSEVQASASAALANQYAAQARTSAVDAGKEAGEAARLSSAALKIATDLKTKEENEQREQDEAFQNYEVPDRIDEFENGTQLYYIDGACHLNGVKLPANIGAGSCVGLVHDFDEWLESDGSNVDVYGLENNPVLAELVLQAYCSDRPDACGGTLNDQLLEAIRASSGPQYVMRNVELGVGGAVSKRLSRLIGVWRIPQVSKVLSGPYRERLNGIAGHITQRDLQAAARELRGEVVARKRNGVPWDHIKEVVEAQDGLENVIRISRGVLNHSGRSAAEKVAAQADLSRASKMLDLTELFVPKVK